MRKPGLQYFYCGPIFYPDILAVFIKKHPLKNTKRISIFRIRLSTLDSSEIHRIGVHKKRKKKTLSQFHSQSPIFAAN